MTKGSFSRLEVPAYPFFLFSLRLSIEARDSSRLSASSSPASAAFLFLLTSWMANSRANWIFSFSPLTPMRWTDSLSISYYLS